jgi:hypothetical protein
MATKMRRPNQPTPPKAMSDSELATARVDQIESRRAEHEAWVARIAQSDPGRRLPPAQAQEARQEQLNDLERHIGESERLAIAAELRESQEREHSGLGRKLRRAGLVKAAADDVAMKKFHEEMRAARLEQEREREAKAKIAEIADKRKHPADPRAASILAAVMSSGELYEALTRRWREVDGVDETGKRITAMSVEPVLDVLDVGLLGTVMHLLSQRNPVIISANHGGTWPAWSDLPRFADLLERIGHLAANQWLTITADGSDRAVTYGPAALRVARDAGVHVTVA